jgi:uncharacterized protein YjiS (DUF1127 family)
MTAIYQMVSSSSRRGSKTRTPKPSVDDLAKLFLEWQRLRKHVNELEQLEATDIKAPRAQMNEARHRK